MKAAVLIFKGVLMGIANIIPGVSGGTIAVVLHVFDEMIEAINNFYKSKGEFVKRVKFLVPLFLGALIGIGLFSKLLKFCLEQYSLPTNMFFVGLVVGSIPLIYSRCRMKKVKKRYFLATVVAFLVVAGFSLIKEPETLNSVTALTPVNFVKIMVCGVIASAAMVVPGISGSFVMMLLGIYNKVITSVSNLIDEVGRFAANIGDMGFGGAFKGLVTCEAFFIIAAVGIGVVIGVLLISKIIEILFIKVYSYTYFAILGLILGSIFSIFKDPLTYSSYSGHIGALPIVCAVITFIVGTIISLFLGKE